jgi:glucose 1-dehydrogenase
MRALTIEPGRAGSLVLIALPDPEPGPGEVLVEAITLGVCGTDREIANGEYGWAPPGQRHLVIGHESLGRVVRAPSGSEITEGDLVAGVVRRPDPVPCGACARGQFDMCRNGRYTECGIKELDGFGSQLWCVPADYAVVLDPSLGEAGVLMEPTSIVAKAWDQVWLAGERAWFEPQRALVTGAGPIGLLAALLGVQRGLEVHVLDRVAHGAKPRLVKALGATYHHAPAAEVAARLRPDVVIEATGVGEVVYDAVAHTAPYGVTCLTGVSTAGHRISVDAGALNRDVVLENDVIVGSVNANLDHYRMAADALAKANLDWLAGLLTRQVPLDRYASAFAADAEDIKAVVSFADS